MSTTKMTREEALARLKRSQARKKERLAEMESILRQRYFERTGEEPKYFNETVRLLRNKPQ